MTYQTTVICYMLVQSGGGLSSDGSMIIVLLYSMPMEVCMFIYKFVLGMQNSNDECIRLCLPSNGLALIACYGN